MDHLGMIIFVPPPKWRLFFLEWEEIGKFLGKAEKGCFPEIFGFQVKKYASLEIIPTSSTSRDASPYRPYVVPLSFPLLGLGLKAVPFLSTTGIWNTRKVRSVRHVCDEFDEKPKNNNRIQVKRRKFVPGQIPRRVFNSGRWEMLQTSSIRAIRKTIHNL